MNRYKVSWGIEGVSIPAESVHVFAESGQEAIDKVCAYRWHHDVPDDVSIIAVHDEEG